MHRRHFLRCGAATLLGSTAAAAFQSDRLLRQQALLSSTSSVIPVVGDGQWIWTQPPATQTGYLEARPFSLRIGIELEGTGGATQLRATTPVPIQAPEQKIEDVKITTQGAQAAIQELTPHASQLVLAAPAISKGQLVAAVAEYRMQIAKQYHAYDVEQFPQQQEPPVEVRKSFLQNSPGIETRSPQVRKLAEQLTAGAEHPYQQAEKFAAWVRENIRARIGPYTSVVRAIENRVGDCEERSATFVALCRSVGIPARLVWVPNHNWSEFYLTDHQGQGCWIPVHTAAYSWFGWVGAHELVLQKGDRIQVPQRRRQYRLQEDWTQWSGRQPRIRYTAELRPLPPEEGADEGPGARSKDERGEWKLLGKHEMDRYLRR